MGILDWLNANADGLGVVIAALGLLGGAYLYMKRRLAAKPEEPAANGETRSTVTVRNSPGAKAAGRDMGVTRTKQAPTEATVEIGDSEGAEAAGRDHKR